MFGVTSDFVGGNIRLIKASENEVILKNDLRDTNTDWFYWAFCVEGAAGKTITFKFDEENRVGHFGAAVSSDLENWAWTEGRGQDESFTYTFKENEDKLYFAHHMLYHPKRFFEISKKQGIKTDTLCLSKKGNIVPYCIFGSGEKKIILTARHHCCESTANYILEGVISELSEKPIKGYELFCVPFVDYEGVLAGDQGKNRRPFDHNRDYDPGQKAIYNETEAIRKYATENEVAFAFDFHSPWHKGGKDDECFIVQSKIEKLNQLNRFSELFATCITEKAFTYKSGDDYPPNSGWNIGLTSCSNFMANLPNNDIAFTLEVPYFGNKENVFTQTGAVETGRAFARALHLYINEKNS